MTWGELKISVLQKVFAITDGAVREDDTTREYLTAMPGAANEGMQLLATAGRLYKRYYEIAVHPEEATGATAYYDLAALLPDFDALDTDGVYFTDSFGNYGRSGTWGLEGGKILTLDMSQAGVYRIWYNAFPPRVTAATADDYVLPMTPEAAALLPLYIASQVYKDDDIAIATQYRNEFEVGREAMQIAAMRGVRGGRDTWRSVNNWV